MYKPNIKSKVDPDIPGKIIADIAIIATKNTYIAEPKLKLFKAIVSPPDINWVAEAIATNLGDI